MRGTLTSDTHAVPADAEAFFAFAEARGWGDGLPLIPPTAERVQAMLETVDEPPEAVVGVVEPRRGEATVEKIAVNAVMAGCPPEYFPGRRGGGARGVRAALQPLRAQHHDLLRDAGADDQRPGARTRSASSAATAASVTTGAPTPPSAAPCAW